MFKSYVFKMSLLFCLLLFSSNCFGSIGVEVTPNSWDVGIGGAGTWVKPDPFIVKNIGTDPAKVDIRGTNTDNWTLANSPSTDIFAMQWNTGSGWNSIETSDKEVVPSLAGDASFNFNLQYLSPTGVTDTGLTAIQTSVVTVSAVSPIIIIGIWEIQTVDAIGSVGSDSSIAVDSNGYAHISYLDYTNLDLKYAKLTETGWDIQTVDSSGDVGWQTSIKLDSNNYPHISYLDRANSALKYAKLTETGWDIQTVDSAGNVGGYSSIVIDANGNPHISYFDSGNHAIKYAYRTDISWSIQTIEAWSTNDQGYSSIAIDATGNPHIAYFAGYNGDDVNRDLRYAKWIGSSWDIQTVDSAGEMGLYPSLAIDSDNYAHISYLDKTNYDLKYAKLTETGWDIQIVDSIFTTGFYSSIDIDINDYPHISYHGYDSLGNSCKYAKWTELAWDIKAIDLGGAEGTSLALDKNDCPHISYSDQVNKDLKYARWK